MRTGILSIQEPYAEAIFSGEKKFEFRRKAPNVRGPTRFLVYVPGRRRELVGEILVERIIRGTPRSVWNKVGRYGGISRETFDSYFWDRQQAFALAIRTAHRYSEPWPLDTIRDAMPGGFTPPQFLKWLSASDCSALGLPAGSRLLGSASP